MSLIYKSGDLFSTKDKAIAHGCNTMGVMGSGVAKIVKEKYPFAFNGYYTHFNKMVEEGNHHEFLGECVATYKDDMFIFNLITQNLTGNDGMKYVSYDAVDSAVKKNEPHHDSL